MALARWQRSIVNGTGDVQPLASIEVRKEVPGQPLVALFSDVDGLVPIANPSNNPFLADAEGFAAFHVAGGFYQITATLGGFTRVWRRVAIGTAAALDGEAIVGVAGASGDLVGDGVTVAFDITILIGSAASLLWVEDGIVQRPGIDFTVSGSVVTRTTAPAEDAIILWILFGSAGDVTDLSTKVDKAGDAMSGPLSLSGDGSSAFHAVPKQQLDASIATEVTNRNSAITAAVVGLFDDRGNYDASGNVFPSTGGSGTAGAVLKGDIWLVSVAGTLGGAAVAIGDTVRALVDTPGQTAGNWAIGEANIVGAVTLTATQTLANKTLTNPVINSPTGLLKGDVGLGNVDNTSDANKPVSTAQAAAIGDALKALDFGVNGKHAVSQQNALSSVAVSDNTYTYLSDQWAVHTVGAMRVSGQVVSDAPAGFGQSLKLTLTTADASLAATDVGFWEQPIEGYLVEALGLGAAGAAPFALAEMVKANMAMTLYYYFQNSARDRTLVKSVTLVADTWKAVRFSSDDLGEIIGDTTGTWLKTSGVGLRAGICFAAGPNFHTTAGSWQAGNYRAASDQTNWAASLTGGSGSAAPTLQRTGFFPAFGTVLPSSDRLPFVMRSYPDELNACLRYLPSLTGGGRYGIGGFATGNAAYISVRFDVRARVAPTGIVPGTLSEYSICEDGIVGGIVLTNMAGAIYGPVGARLLCEGGSSPFTASHPAQLDGSVNSKLFFTGAQLI